MNSTIGGEDIYCPCCKKILFISFDHSMSDEHLDEITSSVVLKK